MIYDMQPSEQIGLLPSLTKLGPYKENEIKIKQ
jgi:hypothetical protein